MPLENGHLEQFIRCRDFSEGEDWNGPGVDLIGTKLYLHNITRRCCRTGPAVRRTSDVLRLAPFSAVPWNTANKKKHHRRVLSSERSVWVLRSTWTVFCVRASVRACTRASARGERIYAGAAVIIFQGGSANFGVIICAKDRSVVYNNCYS